MPLLLAVLEREAVKAAARGKVREVIRELSELRDGFTGSGVPALHPAPVPPNGSPTRPDRA